MFDINKIKPPQSDELVERFNGKHQENLGKVIDDNQQHWDNRVPIFLMAYRSAMHSITALAPAKILFGSNPRLHADLKFWTLLMSKESTSNVLPD